MNDLPPKSERAVVRSVEAQAVLVVNAQLSHVAQLQFVKPTENSSKAR